MVKFNKEQLEVINHKEGNCVVMAGAGSGKSTCLVNRIAKLIESGVNPQLITAITFTKNSANDLKSKLEKLHISDVNVGTFHSICSKILITNGYLFRNSLKEYEIENLFKKVNNGEKTKHKDILSFISYQKAHMRGYNDEFVYKESEYFEEELRVFYKEYEDFKRSKCCLDFDDLLIEAYKLLLINPDLYKCEYLLVDEAQDNNFVQNNLLNLLCTTNNIMLIGDVRQSIYSFRGSRPDEFMRFDNLLKDCRVINLDTNYRSKKNIVDNANGFMRLYYGDYEFYSDSISNNKTQGEVQIVSTSSEDEEAVRIAEEIKTLLDNGCEPKEISVLYRLNKQSHLIENELKLRGIEYDIHNSSNFFNRKEIDIIMCMLRLIHNPSEDMAFEKLLRYRIIPYLSNSTIEDMIRTASRLNISILEASEIVEIKNKYVARELSDISRAIDKLMRQEKSGVELSTIVNHVINIIDLKTYIENNYSTDEEIEERLASIESFKKFIRNNTLESFLSYVYDKSTTQKKKTGNKVQLMTLHGSKGLEFENVFMIGINDGKFPNAKAEILDESRLMYVGVTRAKTNLWLSSSADSTFIREYKMAI